MRAIETPHRSSDHRVPRWPRHPTLNSPRPGYLWRDAQAAIAREYGFERWSDLTKRVTELSRRDLAEVEKTENAIHTPEGYTDRIRQVLGNCLIETNLSQGEKFEAKVRDRYDLGDRMVLITTDRQSAFDRVLAAIPFKGQVLNMTSAWWFEQTRHIVPNQVLSVPDPNVTDCQKMHCLPD